MVQMYGVWTESDLVNLLLLPFEILPSRFEVLGLVECGLGVFPQFVEWVLKRKVIL